MLQEGLLFAVVDLETTGGKPELDGIIELAVCITDGRTVMDTFETLINPLRPIPPFIQRLTGINPDMLEDAPLFDDVAPQLLEMLKGKIFVAHNVAFDYNFIRHHFKLTGTAIDMQRLCTVRYAREVLPGLASYSLGNLCRDLDITVDNRHRALGDALAATEILHRALSSDTDNAWERMLKKEGKRVPLPPNLPAEVYDNLPMTTGVYYMVDEHNTPLYIGKAKNIRKRINQHLQKDLRFKDMKRLFEQVHDITYVETGTELIACLLEAQEIKEHRPPFNYALKRKTAVCSIYRYTDQNGYNRLAPSSAPHKDEPLYSFTTVFEARRFLQYLGRTFGLCEKMLGLQRSQGGCLQQRVGQCQGACIGDLPAFEHNAKFEAALLSLQEMRSNVLIIGPGRRYDERSIVCCERGAYLGFGYVDQDITVQTADMARDYVNPIPNTADAQRIIKTYLGTVNGREQVIRY